MLTRIAVLLFALGLALPVWADPEETVQWIYDSLAGLGPDEYKGLAYLSSPELRSQYFTDSLVAFFEAEDSYRSAGLPGCVAFTFDKPGPVFDAATAQRTLTLSSTYWPDRQDVTASFSNGGEIVRLTYKFLARDDVFKIDDIAGPGWRASRFVCTPRGAAQSDSGSDRSDDGGADPVAYTGGAAQYCYSGQGNALRLDVGEDGRAAFFLKSVQSTGHSCKASGEARWTGEGWRYDAMLESGHCVLEFLVTAGQGLRLADPGFECKPSLCGQRATLDGLVFARSEQIDCAYFRQ